MIYFLSFSTSFELNNLISRMKHKGTLSDCQQRQSVCEISGLNPNISEQKKKVNKMSLPTMRRPVHVEFDFNDLHVAGDLLTGKDHIYKVEAVIDSKGKTHKLSPNESLAILRCIEGLSLHGFKVQN